MKSYNFDKIISREGTNSIKYDARKSVFGHADVIPMWVADMDFEAPDFITETLTERVGRGGFGYEFRGEAYYKAICDWIGKRNGWKIDSEWIEFTPGIVSGFSFAVRAFSKAGGRVVIMPPVYPPFAGQTALNGRTVVNSPLVLTDGEYRIDFDDLDSKLEGADALLFCNPHNPTGRVFSPDELMQVGELCVRHGVYIISDEIHGDLIQKPYHHTHIASLDNRFAQRTITFVAPSKTFNVAGLSTSAAIIPDKTLRETFRRELANYHVDLGNVFGTAVLEAAYTHGDKWLDELIEYIGHNILSVDSFITRYMPEIKCIKPQGTYLMWIDFNGLGLDHEQLIDFLVNKARLGLNDGLTFGEEGRGFMRMNLATSNLVVTRALDNLFDAYKELKHI